MTVFSELQARADDPITVALVGTGVYGSHLTYGMEATPGIEPTVLADVEVGKAERTYRRAGVDPEVVVPATTREELAAAANEGRRVVTADGRLAAGAPVDVVVEATGDPGAAAEHAWTAIEAGNDLVMASVELDATVGPILARLAGGRGVTYSMTLGDEPAHVVRLCEWARTLGLSVVAAGQGTELRLDPHGTPDDVLERYGLPPSFVEANDPNRRMYNTFLDGTKVAVELCAAANALGFSPDVDGPHVPETDRRGTLETFRPARDGGVLDRIPAIDAVTPTDTNPSAFVVTEATNGATRAYLDQRFNVTTTGGGRYQLFTREDHLPQETAASVASVALDDRPTAVVRDQTSEVVGAAKRDLEPGETIAGPGDDTVYGELASASVADDRDLVPLELLAGAEVVRPVGTDERIADDDVELDTDSTLYHLRQLQDRLL